MDIDKEIQRRLIAQRLGTTYFASRKINIWSEINKEELKQWAVPGAAMAQGALAGDAGQLLSHALAEKFNHNFDEYDRAIDAVFNEGLGGSPALHHILDGQHSLWNAFNAVKTVAPDDSFLREVYEATGHLLRDLCSASGINPLFTMTHDTFNSIAAYLAPMGVSKMYLADALTVNGTEVLGAAIAIIAMLLGRKSLESEKMAELAGSLITAAIAGGNPLLLPVAGYFIYRSYNTGKEIPWGQLSYSMGKGALVTGIVVTTSTVIGGPVWVGLAAGIAAAIAFRAGIGKVQELWTQLWPAYFGFEQRFPLVIRQIDISALP